MTFSHNTLPYFEEANLARGMFAACRGGTGQVT